VRLKTALGFADHSSLVALELFEDDLRYNQLDLVTID
jgi:hypothetical protein